MPPECLSSLWCFRQPPSPSDDGVGLQVFIPTEVAQPGNEEVVHSRLPSSAGNADIAVSARGEFEGSLPPSSADIFTSAVTQAGLAGPRSPEDNVEVHVSAHAEQVPSVSPSSRPPYRLNPEKARQHINRIRRFRILIMGRANAGKTTILQRLCNTTDEPEIFNAEGRKVDATVVQGSLSRGHHNIEDELVFQSNPRFVFHDSCGFEAGSEEQFDLMKKFVMDRSKAAKLDKRIHVIWFCIPLTDSHRMVTAAEKKFFDECDTGNVPVILLATKADTLEIEAIQKLEDEGMSVGDVVRPGELENEILNNYMARLKDWLGNMRFPPHDYLPLTGMEQVDARCTALLTCTANALKEEGLQWLLISTQQCNLELCMTFAIMKTLKKFMCEQIFKIEPMLLAFSLASWFPFHYEEGMSGGMVGSGGQMLTRFITNLLPLGLWGRGRERGYGLGRYGLGLGFGHSGYLEPGYRGYGGPDMDDYLVPAITNFGQSLTMPMLSTSTQYSMQYIAEHGIGSVLVFEYLYFLLQFKNGSNHIQEDLTLAVEEYQRSGVHAKVNKLIQAAFAKHGQDVKTLCHILLEIARENQLSKVLNRDG